MIEIIDKEHCTGCGACLSLCAQSAITMQTDEEGFDYPFINQTTCVDCGLCQRVCPPLHYEDPERLKKRKEENCIQRGFASRNKNYEERLRSSSGSVFAVLSHQILNEGGIVVGVAFDDDFNAVYRIIENAEDLHYIQGSKYLQCKADVTIFDMIRKQLNNGRNVLFSGLACQVEGLRAYLRKDYDSLVCVDLICMGVPSASVWKRYLSAYFKGEVIQAVNFKEKSIGWNHFNLAITTNKREFKQWGMINPYFKSMFNTYNMRQSCFVCPFKNRMRAADITLADCWGANKLAHEIDDNKGLSSVIIHSQKGLQLWEGIADKVDQKELPLNEIIKGNVNMIENRICDKENRDTFYKFLNSGKTKKAFHFAEMHGENVPLSISARFKIKIKRIIDRIIYEYKGYIKSETLVHQ